MRSFVKFFLAFALLMGVSPVVESQAQSKRFEEIKDLILSLEGDFSKFYDKGNQAAGTRVRKGMQDLKRLAQDIRVEVQQLKSDKSAAGSGGQPAGYTIKANPFPLLLELTSSFESDFEKFYNKNNQAAGTRVRSGMQDLKFLAHAIFRDVK